MARVVSLLLVITAIAICSVAVVLCQYMVRCNSYYHLRYLVRGELSKTRCWSCIRVVGERGEAEGACGHRLCRRCASSLACPVCSSSSSSSIPKVVIVTTPDKSRVPDYIWQQYHRHAKGYEVRVFEDADCEDFLAREYDATVVQKFRSLPIGAWKADLFRYAYLYKHGGVYLDVKTLLRKDLDDTMSYGRENVCYMVYNPRSVLIYNGIICTPPNNRLMLHLMLSVVQDDVGVHDRRFLLHLVPKLWNISYIRYVRVAAKIVRQYYSTQRSNNVLVLRNQQRSINLPATMILWTENTSRTDLSECNGRLDRHKTCSVIRDVGTRNVLFNTRDPAYGTSWQ